MIQHASDAAIAPKQPWLIAAIATLVLTFCFGAPWITTVALTDIAAEVGGVRSVPSLAVALAWFGSGFGGIAMGWAADRVGVRWTVAFGAAMIALGLALSTQGPGWPMYIGHGVFIGLFGLSGINAPLFVYVSKLFERRRGSALALISSGSYLAGAVWPPIFAQSLALIGWRQTMLWYAVLTAVVVVPLSLLFLKAPPTPALTPPLIRTDGARPTVLGWPPNLTFALLAAAIFTCCVPMSMPQAHVVAFCGDLGITASQGAAMLSVMLAAAFLSRQVWGLIADRIGGLLTVLAGSAVQAITMSAFLVTQDEVGLFAVAAAFGLGFSGLIPATILAARELFPVGEASWRIPTMLLCSASGMATGGWLAGGLYDYFGYYVPAFAAGIAVNLINFAIIAVLTIRQQRFAAAA